MVFLIMFLINCQTLWFKSFLNAVKLWQYFIVKFVRRKRRKSWTKFIFVVLLWYTKFFSQIFFMHNNGIVYLSKYVCTLSFICYQVMVLWTIFKVKIRYILLSPNHPKLYLFFISRILYLFRIDVLSLTYFTIVSHLSLYIQKLFILW